VPFALAAGVAAGVIYGIFWVILGKGSVWRLLLTAVITFVVAFVLKFAFTAYFARRRG